MLDIFSREGLKGTERGRVEDLMAIIYAKQREYINANPSPSIVMWVVTFSPCWCKLLNYLNLLLFNNQLSHFLQQNNFSWLEWYILCPPNCIAGWQASNGILHLGSSKCRFASGSPVLLGVWSLFVNSLTQWVSGQVYFFEGTFVLLVIEYFFIDIPHLTL